MTRCPVPREKVAGHVCFREAMRDRRWIGVLEANVKLGLKLIETFVYSTENDDFIKDQVKAGKAVSDVLSMDEFETFAGAFAAASAEPVPESSGEPSLSIEAGLDPEDMQALKTLKGDERAVVAKADAEAERIVAEHVHLIDGTLAKPMRGA